MHVAASSIEPGDASIAAIVEDKPSALPLECTTAERGEHRRKYLGAGSQSPQHLFLTGEDIAVAVATTFAAGPLRQVPSVASCAIAPEKYCTRSVSEQLCSRE